MSDCRVPMPFYKLDDLPAPSDREYLELIYKALDEYTDELANGAETQRQADLVARVWENVQVLYRAAIKGCE